VIASIFADVRYALRWLRKSPAFAVVAVASLAIGIGFNTALFTIVDAVLFRPLPVAGVDRLVDVYTSAAGASAAERFGTTSYPDYRDLRAGNDVFDDLVGYSPMFGALNLGDRSRLTLGEIVTGNYFRMLGVGAAAGRTLLPEDDAADAPRVAMISYRYWTRELGAAPDVVGRTLGLRGRPFTIVGVAPRGFSGMTSILSPDLWVPMSAALEVEPIGLHDVVPSPTGTTRLDRRGDRWMFLKGRLKPGVTIDRAAANLDVLMARFESANPATNKNRRIAVKPTSNVHFHPALDPQILPAAAGLMAVVGLVLLIACANVASMLLSRATGRQKEIGIRLAIGATRGRLVRQLVTESLVMSAIGAAAGTLLAWWITWIVGSLDLPVPFPMAFDLRIDARALLFTTGATLGAGLLAGLIPAAKASRVNLVADLRGEKLVSRATGLGWSLGDVLVACQMAVTTTLLVCAALLTRSLIAEQHANLGFAIDRLALVSLDTTMVQYSPERSIQFYNEALARVRAIPGVDSAALATFVPFSLNGNQWDVWIPGRHAPGDHGDVINATRVSPFYFRTIGVPILQGRGFTDDDRADTPRVAVINETMARRYWPGVSAIGRTFNTNGSDGKQFRIVGIAADHKVSTIGEAPMPFIHVARAQQPNSYNIVIARTQGDAPALLRDMRRALLALEPNLVFVESQTMEGEVATTLFLVRASAWLVGVVGLVAMALAAIGLYGVIAYSVAQRTREIGIRLALGAAPSSVLGLIMRQGLRVAAVGLAFGCLAGVFASRLIAGALYGIGAGDPVSWGAAVAVLLSVSAAANLVPARRASRVDPSEALRVE
jgi:macrolide transport system ATP-binding/permease protein